MPLSCFRDMPGFCKSDHIYQIEGSDPLVQLMIADVDKIMVDVFEESTSTVGVHAFNSCL